MCCFTYFLGLEYMILRKMPSKQNRCRGIHKDEADT